MTIEDDRLSAFVRDNFRSQPRFQKTYADLTDDEREAEADRVSDRFRLNLAGRRQLKASGRFEEVVLAVWRMDWPLAERVMAEIGLYELPDVDKERS